MRLNLRLTGSSENLMIRLEDIYNITSKDGVIDSLAIMNLILSECERAGPGDDVRLGIQKNGEFMAITNQSINTIQDPKYRIKKKTQRNELSRHRKADLAIAEEA